MNVNMIHTRSSSRYITKKNIMINYKIDIHISIEKTYSANKNREHIFSQDNREHICKCKYSKWLSFNREI